MMMRRVNDIFGERHSSGNTALGRLDVRVKLFTALSLILAVVLSHSLTLPLAVFVACLAVVVLGRIPPRRFLLGLAVPLGLAMLVCLLRIAISCFHLPADARHDFWISPVFRAILGESALIMSRVAGAMGVVLLLGMFSPAYRIFAALRWAKLPRSWVEIAMLMYRYIFAVSEQAISVHSAQKIRLGYTGFGRTVASAGQLAGIVALRSIDQADKTHEAMVARGYHGSLQITPLPPLKRIEAFAIVACPTVVALIYAFAERWLF